jgi:DNA topoisomerase IA
MTPSTIAAGDLPIAESPAKAKTIARHLGPGRDVTAQHGCVIPSVAG